MTQTNFAAENVPMMFRAQVQGRCQLQYAQSGDIHKWKSQWIDSAKPQAHNLDTPETTEISQSKSYKISWRFVTNGGQDDGIIRPVIGARGLPYYPGSSMKGLFRKACTPEEGDLYCGKALPYGDFQPGILRFHGGYPTNNNWKENLIDIVHPQQGWQVKTTRTTQKPTGESAFAQISLYKPTLVFRISSSKATNIEWIRIWEIWEKALSMGIGCRVCMGYGQPKDHTGKLLYKVQIKGEGQAAKLLDGAAEFRPNIFRAALRGHALRIFGGLTDETTAETLVAILFGNIQKGNDRAGLLSMKFQPFPPTASGSKNPLIQEYGQANYQVDTYKVEGELSWLLTQNLPEAEQAVLKELIKYLIQFAMIFGGFGKSWRRADHRLFYEEYYNNPKPMIGCHWQWLNASSVRDVKVRELEDVSLFIDKVRQAAQNWMTFQKDLPKPKYQEPWREAWHPNNVQVWGRIAEEKEDCEAIRWLHGSYRRAIPQIRIREGSIYQSSVTGQVGQIGRLWHRMYPVIGVRSSPENPRKKFPVRTGKFLELLTLFPDNSEASDKFLHYLTVEQKRFQLLWGEPLKIAPES